VCYRRGIVPHPDGPIKAVIVLLSSFPHVAHSFEFAIVQFSNIVLNQSIVA